MTKPGDLQIKKTIHELVKEFPDKTYGELERYRNADRQEEAQRIITQQENEELTESQQKQEELEPIEGVDWEKLYKKEHRLRQEAEKELEGLKEKIDPAHITQRARESGL
tara:strand:+ start:622 stop:951 length:330 start_codon:yes stop_codon:yes gene_type:complete